MRIPSKLKRVKYLWGIVKQTQHGSFREVVKIPGPSVLDAWDYFPTSHASNTSGPVICTTSLNTMLYLYTTAHIKSLDVHHDPVSVDKVWERGASLPPQSDKGNGGNYHIDVIGIWRGVFKTLLLRKKSFYPPLVTPGSRMYIAKNIDLVLDVVGYYPGFTSI